MKVEVEVSNVVSGDFKMHINGYITYVSFGDLPTHGVCGLCGSASSEDGNSENFYSLRATKKATMFHEVDLLSGEGPFLEGSKPFEKIRRKIAKAFSKQGDGLCEDCFWETVKNLGEIV
ncbi:MAG TPA: hypothetical protein DCS28_01535 [Candidatus Moranbacteria bacterium]|nr:hypothetical protein [Candidatus Moranbacteria bacterium]HAT74707.1 hypothetical protein [Candidatus Moranbacteria bacterium]